MMMKVMQSDSDNILREINLDGFLQRLNNTLLMADPEFAKKMGITSDASQQEDLKEQTPEELAEQEAERERVLQESMQAEVINSVMKRVEGNLSKYDENMKDQIGTIRNELNTNFKRQETTIAVNIKNLEKYLEDVHSQQISEFEVLKKFTHAIATGKEDLIETHSLKDQPSQSISKKSWVED